MKNMATATVEEQMLKIHELVRHTDNTTHVIPQFSLIPVGAHQKVSEEIKVPVITPVEMVVNVPKLVEQEVIVPVIKFVEKVIEVPVVKYVEYQIMTPRITNIERIVEVPKIVFVEKEVEIPSRWTLLRMLLMGHE